MYARYGFEVSKTIPWDDKYAPRGWNYEKDGRPNVVEMVYKGDKNVTDITTENQYGTGVLRPGASGREGIGGGDSSASQAVSREGKIEEAEVYKKLEAESESEIAEGDLGTADTSFEVASFDKVRIIENLRISTSS